MGLEEECYEKHCGAMSSDDRYGKLTAGYAEPMESTP
jgi:hypothetical protein